jgi:hypothetical protein
MNCISLKTHSAASSEACESYDEQYCACKPQRSILISTLLPFLAKLCFLLSLLTLESVFTQVLVPQVALFETDTVGPSDVYCWCFIF